MSLNTEIANERTNETKREMGWRGFNDVRLSKMPDGREVSLLEFK